MSEKVVQRKVSLTVKKNKRKKASKTKRKEGRTKKKTNRKIER